MVQDLKDDAKLKIACESVLDIYRQQPGYQKWTAALTGFLQKVHNVEREEFLTEDFQQELWDSVAVSATGMGNVDVSALTRDSSIAESLWKLKQGYLTSSDEMRHGLIDSTSYWVLSQIESKLKRRPLLKLCRVFAALCPGDFTTITNFRKLHELAVQMGYEGTFGQGLIEQRWVRARLNQILGNVREEFSQPWIERMTLPWLLYVVYVQKMEVEPTETIDLTTGEEKLIPLSADRRRRGMLAIGGSTSTIRTMIEFAKDGCSREDFREHLHSINPSHATTTLSTQLNALIAEWGVLRAEGDNLQLTARGESFLESGDTDEFCDWLLTRILGFDNAIYLLRQSPISVKAMIFELQKVNSGWTSTFVPNCLITWLRSLALVELTKEKTLQLTEKGQRWAARVDWIPGVLVVDASIEPANAELQNRGSINRLELAQIVNSFDPLIAFRPEVVGQLDAGLWSHHRRHFAVLTGLSGAGKTVLARSYALGLWQQEPVPHEGLITVAVQPGWHDPSCLLGYVNPLNSDVYVRTAFLDFLLRATVDPDRAYTVILDEMNLSHPEQYLAPLLSAMETGDAIELHAQGSEINGVPASIPYPGNLFIIGTVNMDETTHGLSDKVLDRACVIEFWDIDVDSYPAWKDCKLSSEKIERIQVLLKELVAALRPVRLHFGWRTIGDVLGYVREALRGNIIEFENALDQSIYSKVLPKLRGEDTPRLQNAFAKVRAVLQEHKMVQSEAKVAELLDDLKFSGSARFWR
jgi:hypothetical protein